MVTYGLPKNFARFFVKTCAVSRVLTQARPSGSRRRRQRWRRWTCDDQRMGNLTSQCDVSPNPVTPDSPNTLLLLHFLPHVVCYLCYDGVVHEHGGQTPGREDTRWRSEER